MCGAESKDRTSPWSQGGRPEPPTHWGFQDSWSPGTVSYTPADLSPIYTWNPSHPARSGPLQSLQSPRPWPPPVSSFSFHLYPFSSLLQPPHPRPPPSLGDKRARLERVPRSFIPHHMGPKAKSSAKRLNQVCRTKCYELTLWVYNFMPFVAICLSKQPPFHTDIQTHTFSPSPPPTGHPHPGQGSGTKRYMARS